MAGETPPGSARWADALESMRRSLVERATAAERERCARMVELECVYLVGKMQARTIADRIRRGE